MILMNKEVYVIMRQEVLEVDDNSLNETLYVISVPNLKEELIKRANANEEEFVNEDEVEWN